jgi:hypothetical protein
VARTPLEIDDHSGAHSDTDRTQTGDVTTLVNEERASRNEDEEDHEGEY